jgi:cellulose synthase/poly-beta-1,6-N-acetylglucosamine synthase-like glycosyltransferase
MTPGQAFYVAAVLVYLIFFVMFARFYFWKKYADTHYWNRRPRLTLGLLRRMAREGGAAGGPACAPGGLPYFSILVPARNEADVIERTIDHMATLDYPSTHYEVVVATDEKEVHARQAQGAVTVEFAHTFITEAGDRSAAARGGRGETARLVVGLLVDIALKECLLGGNPCLEGLPAAKVKMLGDHRQFAVLVEIALELLKGRGHIHMGRTLRLIRRARADLDPQEARQVYPIYLSLAIPVVAAYWSMRGVNRRRLVDRMVERTAHAHHGVTRKILASMTEVICVRILRRLDAISEGGRLPVTLNRIYRRCFPTTQDIVDRKVAEFGATPGRPVLKHVLVPYDYNGQFGGVCTGQSVPSTKGRALNYALTGFLDERTSMCGFYDAESRPDPKVMQYVAYRRLTDGDRVQVMQGPIFQVRNFYEMGPFCKIACVYQAIAHDWYLPVLFRRLPFVGGTNLFADRRLFERIGGYDPQSLTEDLELGVRAYLECDAWPEYLPYASTEQTPPTLRAFYRQRLRWGTGHLQVMDKVRTGDYAPAKKRPLLRQLFIRGQVEWILYQAATLIPPAVLLLWYTGNLDPSVLPEFVRWILNFMSLVYFGFTVYAYYRYRRFFDSFNEPFTYVGRVGVFLQLFFLPLAAFFFPVPYTTALVLKVLNRQPRLWHKTPRTREF